VRPLNEVIVVATKSVGNTSDVVRHGSTRITENEIVAGVIPK
jgi:hypothetical protein